MKVLALTYRMSALTKLFLAGNGQKATSNLLKCGMLLLLSVTLWGCGKGNPDAPVTIDPVTKKHPAGWAANGTGGAHPDAYFNASGSCEECHGKPLDPAGGISRVSCSNPGRSGVACHASFPHIAGFAVFTKHGSVAKDLAIGISGMAHCQKCHGSSYTGAGSAPSCIGCHKETNPSSNAPHAANWINGNANGLKHSTTDTSNAPACAQCHLGGQFSHSAQSPAPAGTAPGCFNGTLCHNAVFHSLPFVAGRQAIAVANLSNCQPCHATHASGSNPRFNLLKGSGVLNPNGCEGCHNKPGIAHPFMWLPGRGTTNGAANTTSHATAGTVNASCGLCHGGTALAGGGSAPSCFSNPVASINGTTCHFTKPVATDGSSIGCVSCHGLPPDGTTAPNRAFRHTKHWALPGITANGGCDICHNGLGSGKTTHADGTPNTSFFSAKFRNVSTVAASYNAATGKCDNVSCHGLANFTALQVWKGTFPVLDPADSATCTFCHKVSAVVAPAAGVVPVPYIGPFSGKIPVDTAANGFNLHQAHTGPFGVLCLDCHNLSVHFKSLMTGKRKLNPGDSAAAVGGAGTAVTSYTYNGTTGTSTCFSLPNNPVTGSTCHAIATPLNPLNPRSWY